MGTCRFEVTRPGWFVYNTDAATQDAITQALAREDVPRRSLTLDLSLIMADNTSEAPLTLKGGEAQALADLRQLLPYQGYRLLESGRLRIQDRGQIHMGSMPSYAAEFRLGKQVPAGSDLVKFESFELIHTHLVPGGDSGAGDTTTDVILRTGFTMEVGETVVVGTSRLNGSDEALIVLLTASR